MNEYQQQAENFLAKTKTIIKIEKSKNQSPPLWAKNGEDHGFKYDVILERNGRKWQFNFWDSISNKEKQEQLQALRRGEKIIIRPIFQEPFEAILQRWGKLSVLRGAVSDLQAFNYYEELIRADSSPSAYDILAAITKYDSGSFADFCANFGYDEDSKTAEKTFLAVIDEWQNVKRLFGDVLEELQNIN